jgi:hypothetical protein
MLEDGHNVISVSKLLGHKDVSTTMRYLDITEDQIKSAIISIEDDDSKSLDKKWIKKNGEINEKLTDLFNRKLKLRKSY